jgi:GTP-sensing pleiotropic transcriptional regulator CodY
MTIKDTLIQEFTTQGEIMGTEHIIINVTGSSNRSFVVRKLRELESAGMITVTRSRGGRGKRSIYRRNRNSPGYPRR